MTVLLHTVEYDTGNIVIDADAEDTLHDIVCDRISCDEKIEGAEVLELEDDDENRLPVDVSWKIINPEAEQWKQLAKMFYEASTDNVVDVRSAIYQYEKLIKQTTHE